MKRAPLARLLGLMGLLAGCDGLGRAVVDHQEPLPPGAISSTCEPASCDPPASGIELLPELVTRLHDPAQLACPERGNVCSLQPETGDAAASPCNGDPLTEPDELANQRLQCVDLEVELPVVQGECSVTIAGLSLERSTLRLRAGGACAVIMPGLSARQARIELVGPINLILEQRSELEDMSFVGERTPAGAPQLELDLVEGERVVVGDEELPFEGAFHARHTRLYDSSMRTEEMSLESVLFYNALVHTRGVDAVDAVFEQAVLELDGGVLSASSIKMAEVRSCGAMLFAGSNLQRVVLRRCGDELVRIYASVVNGSWLDGWIESDATSFEGVRFGHAEPTDFEQFGGSLYKSAFCSQTQSYRVGEAGGATCMRCNEPGTFEPGGACWSSPTSVVASDRTDCPEFQALPKCEGEGKGYSRPRPDLSR